MKKNKLRESTISIKTNISDLSKNYPVSGSKGKCYQLLFSCFKVFREKSSEECFLNEKSQECDYIVEKLVVKRVPFISSRSPEDILETNRDQLDKITEKVSIAAEENTVFSDASKTQSTLYYYDSLNRNGIINNSPSTYLYFDRNTASELHEKKTNILTTGYSSRIEEIANTMSNLRPDFKECEKLHKTPCSYSHKPKNKTIFGTSTKIYNQKHIESSDTNELQCRWKIPTNKYEFLADNAASTDCTDSSNITLRWKIILKQCK